MASFARDFYANYDRDGLIIDVRRNNGGNIDSWIIENSAARHGLSGRLKAIVLTPICSKLSVAI